DNGHHDVPRNGNGVPVGAGRSGAASAGLTAHARLRAPPHLLSGMEMCAGHVRAWHTCSVRVGQGAMSENGITSPVSKCLQVRGKLTPLLSSPLHASCGATSSVGNADLRADMLAAFSSHWGT